MSAKNPSDCLFAKSHEWLAQDGLVGLSDHAQKEITDVVFVELPKAGKEIKAGEAIAVVESVKAAFDIYAPVSGKIGKVNNDLTKNPGLVNQDPYGSGWLFSIDQANADEGKSLMSYTDYQKFVESGEH